MPSSPAKKAVREAKRWANEAMRDLPRTIAALKALPEDERQRTFEVLSIALEEYDARVRREFEGRIKAIVGAFDVAGSGIKTVGDYLSEG